MLRPSMARGIPALGMAASGRVVTAAMRSMAVRTVAGPTLQLQPMASAPHCSQALGGEFGGRAVEEVGVLVHGKHGDDGEIGGDGVGCLERLLRLIEGGDGFDDEEVDAAGDESANLIGEGVEGFAEGHFSHRLEMGAEGADGAGDPGAGGLLVLNLRGGLAGEGGAGAIDFENAILQAMAGEAKAICAKSVGFDDFRAGLEVFLVNGADEFRVREVEFVVAAVDEDSASVEGRAHGSVAQHGSASEDALQSTGCRVHTAQC